MSVIAWPSNLRIQSGDYDIQWDVQINVSRNGRVTTYGLPGARWTVTLSFPNDLESGQRPQLEALLVSLEGGANRLQMGHLGRKMPNGTMRGTPTLQGAHTAGAKQLSLTAVTGTLKAGDILGVPGQLLMVMADASPTSGLMTVQTKPALFSGYANGTLVTWNQPTTLWIPKSPNSGPFPFRAGESRPSFSIDLVEAP